MTYSNEFTTTGKQSSNAIRIAEQKEKIAKSDLLPKVALVAAENFDGPILFELPPIDKNLNVLADFLIMRSIIFVGAMAR